MKTMKKLLLLFLLCKVLFVYSQNSVMIIGGQNANQGQFPWVVDLHYNYQIFDIGHLCGGTLIAPQWVLTAGHCVDFETGDDISLSSLRFNSINSSGPINPNGGEVRTALEVYKHPGYQTEDIDLALIKLSTPVTSITPALLPNLNDENLYDFENDILIAGWGSTSQSNGSMGASILQWVISKIKPCTGNPGGQPTNTDIYFCIGYTDGEVATGAAIGDSGGPSFIIENNIPKLLGVVSHGEGEYTDLNKPGRFVKVINFLNWINSVINPLNVGDNKFNKINIYANDDKLFIQNNFEELLVHVYDISGKLLLTYNTKTTNSFETFDISKLSKGIYITKLTNSYYSIQTTKFLKS